jgi:hypothetical protein
MKRVLRILGASCVIIIAVVVYYHFFLEQAHHSLLISDSHKEMTPSIISEDLYSAILKHINSEIDSGLYVYPDSLLCASVWFDFRGESDSLYIMGGLMALYDEPFIKPKDTFLGFFNDQNHFLCFAVMGVDDKNQIGHKVDISALKTDRETFQKESAPIMSSISVQNHCLFLMSSYSFSPDGNLLINQRRLRR